MAKIGLVLSGGFAKGAYQVGVLKAIKDFFKDEQISYISASSVGVLNAYSFATDRLSVIEEMWLNLKFSGIRTFAGAYTSNSQFSEAMQKIAGESTLGQAHFYAALLNITNLGLNYVNLRDVDPKHIRKYLQASISLPMLSRYTEIAGTRYADGALVDNIPVKPLMKHPFDYAIVVHFDRSNYVFENDYFDSKLIKINFLDEKVIRDSLAFDKDSISYMIKSGYNECLTLFDMVFKNGFDDIEFIYQKIAFLNGLRGKQNFRLTGDVAVNNMNRVLRKIIKSKI